MTATPRLHHAHRVYVRSRWADEWVQQDHVYCDSCTFAAAPSMGEATLRFNYGKVQPANSLALATRGPKEWDGYYVKVEIDQDTEDDPDAEPITWIGLVVNTVDDRKGLLDLHSAATEVPTGTQTFNCRGLEFLLHRSIVDSSFVLNNEEEEIEIGRAIAFNLGSGRDTDHVRLENMSIAGGELPRVFARSIGLAEEWDARRIVDYLLHYHAPKDLNGNDQFDWQNATGESATVLKAFKPTLHVHGKTLKNILDELIDRRRLAGWTLTYSGNGDTIIPEITAFTFNSEDITLPSEETIPANNNQTAWLFDTDGSIQSCTIDSDDATRYDVVIARGQPLGSCFTIGFSRDETLIGDWDSTLEDAYETGASETDEYPDLQAHEKMDANQELRNTDKFKKVYRYFRMPIDWDGVIAGNQACPDPTDDTSETATKFWYPGLRFFDKLPLKTDHDYETVDDVDESDLTEEGSKAEYLRPFAVITDEADDLDEDASPFYYLDRMARGKIGDTAAEAVQEFGGRGWSCSLKMQDDLPGVIIDVQGAPQHAIALEHFQAVDAADEDDYKADLDFEKILVTVFAEFDQHVESHWPEGDLTTDTDALRELIIDVPNARLDYLANATVIGLSDNGTLKKTTGGYVRDDREILQDIARSAFAWYGQARKSITVVKHNLIADHSIGTLITFVGNITDQIEVNSVVTHLTYDLTQGTVTTRTQHGELDLQGKFV